MSKRPIYIRPNNFADYLSHRQDYYLFLDIDGTLSNFTINPNDSIIPRTTLDLLQALQDHGMNIAVVTGRSLTEAKKMLSPLSLPIAATHGLEIALDSSLNQDEDLNDVNTLSIDTLELDKIKQDILRSCTVYDDFFIESKPYSVALHFRKNPVLADEAHAIMKKVLKNHPAWVLTPGKYVWEATPKGINKGTAILYLLDKIIDKASNNACAIFIGDDITDEAGFKAIQGLDKLAKGLDQPLKGLGIKVGGESTCAHYYVNDINEVTDLLRNLLSFCRKRGVSPSGPTNVNSHY
ncbi:trehalose-phosphatase [Psychrobacter proteolyticus]|uniref:trehalose-phosphatase n=1 Tax=Psychrobacter proteolyticus TaxID=147825 RepID=UPI000E0A3665|nr:trehalose-phosphatase [Psychrobacter proteolyticus]